MTEATPSAACTLQRKLDALFPDESYGFTITETCNMMLCENTIAFIQMARTGTSIKETELEKGANT